MVTTWVTWVYPSFDKYGAREYWLRGEPVRAPSGCEASILQHGAKGKHLYIVNYAGRSWYGWLEQDQVSEAA